MGKSVSHLADKPKIIAYCRVDKAEAIDGSDTISVCTERLVVSKQFFDFLWIVNQEVDEYVLKEHV